MSFVSKQTGELCESVPELIKAIYINLKYFKCLTWRWSCVRF